MASLIDRYKELLQPASQKLSQAFSNTAQKARSFNKAANTYNPIQRLGVEIARSATQSGEALAQRQDLINQRSQGKSILDRIRQAPQANESMLFNRGLQKATETVGTIMMPKAKAATTISGLLGFGASKLGGQSNSEALRSGLSVARSAPVYSSIAGATNPYLAKLMPKASGFITSRIAPAIGNVAQGIGIDTATGQQTTPLSLGIDAVAGLAGGSSQFSNANTKRLDNVMARGKALGLSGVSPRVNKVHPEDLDVMREFADEVLRRKGDKKALGELGVSAQRLAEHYFGGDWKYANNKKLAQAFEWAIDLNMNIPREARGQLPKLGLIGGQNATGYGESVVSKFSSVLDKKPRFEIDDSGAKIKSGFEKLIKWNGSQADVKLGDILDHPKLFSQYPQLKNLDVTLGEGMGNSRGTFAGNRIFLSGVESSGTRQGRIADNIRRSERYIDGYKTGDKNVLQRLQDMADLRYGGDIKKVVSEFEKGIDKNKSLLEQELKNPGNLSQADKSTLLHEIQHAIQEIEGFAKGGNSTIFEGIVRPKTDEELSRAIRYSPYEQYQRLSGELEARAVQRRMNMPASQRESVDPYAAEAIATTGKADPREFITRVDSGMQASQPTKGVDRSTQLKQSGQELQTKNLAQTQSFPDEMSDIGIKQVSTGVQETPVTVRQSVPEDPLSLEESISQLPKITPDNALKHKVSFLDYFRTPDKVLEKIGLGKQAEQIRLAHQNYVLRLPKEIGKVTEWYNRVGQSQEASQRLFKYLDGQEIKLEGEELVVAKEMRSYLKGWADELKLPEDKRIASYITHIFEDDFISKEFDPELEKIIADKIPGSVYDPFLQERLGAKGYVEDVFRALDAYVKRATRKVNMDPALESLKKSAEDLPLQSWNYVKGYADRVNLRPTEIDNLIDTTIKQSFIGNALGQRPTARVTRIVRNATYRATLGLNAGSALRNLTQGANTYAQLGERYTARGYFDATRAILGRSDELDRVGVTADSFIQDRTLSSRKQLMEKVDKSLWLMFDLAERINRGAAYFGAKAKALNSGKTEEEAIQAGIDMARKTQFTFGSVDTPAVLQGDIAKTLLQFQSFNLKQLEFLGDMVKEKNVAGMVRYLAAWMVFAKLGGDVLGLDVKDALPFNSELLEGESRIGKTPFLQAVSGTMKAVTKAPGRFGEPAEEGFVDRLRQQNVPESIGASTIPAFTQLKKSITGIKAYNRGYSESKSGRLRYEIPKTQENQIRTGIFGEYSIPEAREYFDQNKTPLGEQQTELYKSLPRDQGSEYIKLIDQDRKLNRIMKDLEDGAIDEKEAESLIGQVNASEQFSPLVDSKNKLITDKMASFTKKKIKSGLPVTEQELENVYLANALSMPKGNRYEKSQRDSELYGKYTTINNSEDLSEAQKQLLTTKIAKELGETPETLQIYSVAKEDNDAKTLYALDQMEKSKSLDDFMRYLANGRKPVNGKVLVSDGVIDNLVEDGVIPESLGDDLKELKFDSNGKLKTKKKKLKKSSTARKAALKSYGNALAQIKIGSPTIRAFKPQRINVKGLTFGG